jgi:hypothetical protein
MNVTQVPKRFIVALLWDWPKFETIRQYDFDLIIERFTECYFSRIQEFRNSGNYDEFEIAQHT